MRAWLFWIFRGYRLMEKISTAALDPNGSLAMAWKRIEAIEGQNTKLAANLLDVRREAESLSMAIEAQRRIEESLIRNQRESQLVADADIRQQLSDLRRLIIAREPDKPPPAQARNWRQVQQFTRDQEEADVAR